MLDNAWELCYNVNAVKTDINLISIRKREAAMNQRQKRVLLLGLAVMLNTVGLFLLLGALGVIGNIPMAAGIAGFAVTAVLSLTASIFAFRN